MEALNISKSEARKLYPDSPKWMKDKIVKALGKEFLSSKITDRVKSFEDAYEEADEATRLEFDDELNTDLLPDTLAYIKLKFIAKILNEGWTPDWSDSNQQKWYPYFSLSSGFGFSYSFYDYLFTVTFVGSRLCFRTEELANHAGKCFLELYENFMTIK